MHWNNSPFQSEFLNLKSNDHPKTFGQNRKWSRFGSMFNFWNKPTAVTEFTPSTGANPYPDATMSAAAVHDAASSHLADVDVWAAHTLQLNEQLRRVQQVTLGLEPGSRLDLSTSDA